MLKAVSDCQRLVGPAFLLHAVGPISPSKMCPVVVALLQLSPSVLEGLLPGLEAE